MNSNGKRARSTSAVSVSPTTKHIRALPFEIQERIKSRIHPIDIKQLNKAHYELTKLKATLLRDFMLSLLAFSEENPECIYTIRFTNERKDWEDAPFVLSYKPGESSSPSSRPNADNFNIARYVRTTYGSKSPSTIRRSQRSDINLDIGSRFDYIARTTKISVRIKEGTVLQRKHLLGLIKDLKQKVFPDANLEQSGGRSAI